MDVVVVRNDDGPSTIEIATGNSGANHVVAVRNASAFAGCQQSGADVACIGSYDVLVVFGNGGNDTVTMDSDRRRRPAAAAGPGADGGEGHRLAEGHAGQPRRPAARHLHGGLSNGNDTLVSGNGPDELHGGPGQRHEPGVRGRLTPCSATAATTRSARQGGTGRQRGRHGRRRLRLDLIPDVDADYNRGFDDDVSVTLDGLANDGEAVRGRQRDQRGEAPRRGRPGDRRRQRRRRGRLRGGELQHGRGLGGNDHLVAYDGTTRSRAARRRLPRGRLRQRRARRRPRDRPVHGRPHRDET